MTTADASVQDEFFGALLGDFLDEAGELLDRLNADLLRLDEWTSGLDTGQREPCDQELMNDMFRSAHSLKGLSAMLGLTEINHLTHKVENVFDAARQESLYLNTEIVEVLFLAHDRLSDMVQSLNDPKPVEARCDEVLARIESLLVEAGVERGPASQKDAEQAMADLTGAGDSEQATSPELPDVDPMEGVVDEGGIPSKYLSIFIDETESAIDTLTETLLTQESNLDASATETLLILSHRIKGSSASVGLNRIAKFAHLMEDLLQIQRESAAALTTGMTDVLLKCVDAMRAYITGFKQGEPDCSQFSPLCKELMRLQQCPAPVTYEPPAAEQPTAVDSPRDETSDLDAETSAADSPPAPQAEESGSDCLAAIRDRLTLGSPDNAIGVLGRVFFQPGFLLVGMKARLVYEKLAQSGNVIFCEPAADTLDTLDELAHLDFAVETATPVDELVAQLRIVSVTGVTAEPLPASQHKPESSTPAQPVPPPVQQPLAPPAVVRQAAPPPDKPAEYPTIDHAAAAVAMVDAASTGAATSGRPTETLRVDIERLDQLMNLAGQLVINKARFGRIGDTLRQAVSNNRTSKSLTNAFGALTKIGETLNECDHRKELHRELDSIRTHVRALQGDLEAVHRDCERISEARASVTDFSDAVHQLDRVVDGIQRSVMDTRMVPIGPLFARFRRVVRDITRGAGKEILLNIRGEKTELDKRMIDELSDPLIHMVRNSADHGIETPSERLAAGKARQGTITLDAFHRGNSIIVQVTDDGRGLDAEKIRAKAIERGIVAEADAERLTTSQIQSLIWEPGFTTAEKVTQISGRGMGMDIVKSKIEEINGTVELESHYGEGTVFTIKLPLTLAILPSLMAQIEGDVFALPMESVVEIVSIGPADVSTVHSVPTARVRGRVIPIVYLQETFRFHEEPPAEIQRSITNDMTLVIIGCEGEEIGLAVDRVLGEEDIVIQSLAENYRHVHGIAGASILGDGRVSLILDITALIEMCSHKSLALHSNEELDT